MLLSLIVASIFCVVLSTIAMAAALLRLGESRRSAVLAHLNHYAAGAFLGLAFFGLLPHALDHAPVLPVGAALIAGFAFCVALERWSAKNGHSHHGCGDCESLTSRGVVLLTGDAVHNLIEGAMLTSAFLVSVPVGLAAAASVLAHELPKGAAIIAFLRSDGLSRRRVMLYYAGSSSMAVVGAVGAYFVAAEGSLYNALALSFASATFIYVSLEEAGSLFKSIHPPAERLRRLALIATGVAIVFALPGGH